MRSFALCLHRWLERDCAGYLTLPLTRFFFCCLFVRKTHYSDLQIVFLITWTKHAGDEVLLPWVSVCSVLPGLSTHNNTLNVCDSVLVWYSITNDDEIYYMLFNMCCMLFIAVNIRFWMIMDIIRISNIFYSITRLLFWKENARGADTATCIDIRRGMRLSWPTLLQLNLPDVAPCTQGLNIQT